MSLHAYEVYACLAVTCHLHFWQNDRDLSRAIAVTRGWNGYLNYFYRGRVTYALRAPITIIVAKKDKYMPCCVYRGRGVMSSKYPLLLLLLKRTDTCPAVFTGDGVL